MARDGRRETKGATPEGRRDNTPTSSPSRLCTPLNEAGVDPSPPPGPRPVGLQADMVLPSPSKETNSDEETSVPTGTGVPESRLGPLSVEGRPSTFSEVCGKTTSGPPL